MSRVRVAVHVHSSWSYDGHWSLARIGRTFRRLGYDAVLLCEHDRAMTADRQAAHREECRRQSRGILLVPGIEYADPENVVHVPVWGPVPFLGEGRPTGELLQDVRRHGGVALLAHPSRRDAVDVVDPEWAALLSGVEMWSRKYDGWRPNPLLSSGGLGALPPYASLDFHRARQLAPLAMVADVPGPPDEASLVAEIAARRLRATAVGLSLGRYVDSWPGRVAQGVDAVRRPVAGLASRLLP